MMFRRVCVGTIVAIVVGSSAPAGASSQLLVTYSGPEVIFGPISGGLKQLPDEVCVTFVYGGTKDSGVVELDDVGTVSMEFGDGEWTELSSFAMTIGPGQEVTALTYQFSPIDTATTFDMTAFNFPLTIIGTDTASGQDFQYQYGSSSQTISDCPWDCVGNDGRIGIDEFLAVIGLWGTGHVNEPCDYDGDGEIGIDEWLKVLGVIGHGVCNVPSCPQ